MKNFHAPMQGIIFALLGFSIFGFTDVCIKLVSAKYDPFAIAFYMNIFTIIFMTPVVLYQGGFKKVMTTQSHVKHAFRSYFMLMNFLGAIYGFSHLPLANVYVIAFCFPFIVSILAMIFLNESVGIFRWIAIIIGFTGVLIALRPGLEPISLPMIAVMVGTFGLACSTIVTKSISKSDHWLSFTVYLMLFQTPVLALITLWRGGSLLPDITDIQTIPWFIAAGIAYVIALSAIPTALRKADAAIVGSLCYILFPWGVFYGYFVFNDIPDRWTLLGAVIIICSGLFLIYREHVTTKNTQIKNES